MSDSLIDNLIIIATPYAAYLSGEALHVSAVLATVVAGIRLGRRSAVIYWPETRLVGENVWVLWIYVINAFVFLAIGLQLRTFVQDGSRALALLPAALAISALLIVVRLLWVYRRRVAAARALRRGCARAIRCRRSPTLTLIGWTGMRGIVSLAAALALPLSAQSGAPFPGRDAIVFITFVVIFVTLVGQGLSLIPLVRGWGWGATARATSARSRCASPRSKRACARSSELRANAHAGEEREVLERLRDEYVHRIEHLRSHHAPGVDETAASRFDHEAQNRRCAPSAARSCGCATTARSPTRSSAGCSTTSTSPSRGCFERALQAAGEQLARPASASRTGLQPGVGNTERWAASGLSAAWRARPRLGGCGAPCERGFRSRSNRC